MMRYEVADVRGSNQVVLGRLFADRQRRQRAVVILNAEASAIAAAGKEIAEHDLHRRPANRRTAESLAHGAEYHDSFKVEDPKITNSRIEIRVGNTHPMAKLIEGGSPEHPITPTTGPLLVFPFRPGTRGAPNRKGDFAVAFGEGPKRASRGVRHPGTAAKRIMYRAMLRGVSRSKYRR